MTKYRETFQAKIDNWSNFSGYGNKILQPCLALAHYVQTDDFYSIDVSVCLTSAEHIKCAINDDFYRAVFGVA